MTADDLLPRPAEPSLPSLAIGVFGGATGCTDEQLLAGYSVGLVVARERLTLVTGATTGVPLAAAIGAKSAGGLVVGLSPAASESEHLDRFGRPTAYHDVVVYTGMGIEGRQPIAVRSVDGAIFIGGQFGTLTEFAVAWTAGPKVLGILEGLGGMSDEMRRLASVAASTYGNILLCGGDAMPLAREVCVSVRRAPRVQGVPDPADSVRQALDRIVEGFR